VGHINARSMPSSSMRAIRGSGALKPGRALMALPMISRRDLPSGLPLLKYSSWAPGAATFSKVGLGMYSLIIPLTAIFVRPLTSTYWISPANSGGRNLVNASVVS
jgi:hypothetical protein